MSLIDATDDHHSGQNLQFADVTWITGEKGLHRVWLVGLDNDIDPGTGDVDSWQCVDDLVDLHDHNRVVESGSLNNHRGILSVGTCEEITLMVRLLRAHENNIRNQINQESSV